MNLLDIQSLSFAYPDQEVFRGITFSVCRGEIFCILGPNGCGKTTLLECLLGLLTPCGGKVVLEGRDLTQSSPRQTAKKVAYVPQLHEKTFPYTVFDIVLMGRASYIGAFGVPSKADAAVAEQAIKTVGISHLAKRRYTQLSGGEGQLVMLARALAQQPKIILLDEPTSHLDYSNELMILDTISRLVKETDLTVVMSTHFPNHVFHFANLGADTRVALMKRGASLTVGTPDEVLTEQGLAQLYGIHSRIVSVDINGSQMKHVIPVSSVFPADSKLNTGGNVS